ncbi:MAG: nuclear transport factor 2 family protein [Polyangiales bacterium]
MSFVRAPESPASLPPAQRELWERVEGFWQLLVRGEWAAIGEAIHPRYVGWVTGSESPHDRSDALRSVADADSRVVSYSLDPKSVELYDDEVGIAHYAYRADVVSRAGEQRELRGRWTEIYLRQDGHWLLVGVSGGPSAAG